MSWRAVAAKLQEVRDDSSVGVRSAPDIVSEIRPLGFDVVVQFGIPVGQHARVRVRAVPSAMYNVQGQMQTIFGPKCVRTRLHEKRFSWRRVRTHFGPKMVCICPCTLYMALGTARTRTRAC